MVGGGPARALRLPSSAKQNKEAMKVFLRKTGTDEYYKTWAEWTLELEEAHNFGTSAQAVAVASSQGIRGCEVVLSFGDPAYDVVLGGMGAPDGTNGEAKVDGEWRRHF